MRELILSPITSMASGGGPMKVTPAVGDGAGEVGVLGEEAVAGVDGVGAALLDGVEDAPRCSGSSRRRRLAAERVGLVGHADVQGVAVELGVDGDGAMPSSRQVRMTRTAISPRLAMRTLLSTRDPSD